METDVKITFQNSDIPEASKQGAEKQRAARRGAGRAGAYGAKAYQADPYRVNFMTESEKGWMQGILPGKEKGKTLIELQQEAGNVNVAIQQDYMTVMSNTMSEEDYAKLEEEGFHFADMDPEAAVTIVDKIKAELIRSGKEIIGYTDNVSMDTLAAAMGSEALARAVADSFRQADLPLTEENIDMVRQAWDMASQLNTPTEGACQYMVDNELDPEIWNFYLAQNSGTQGGAANNAPQGSAGAVPHYYAEEIQGYYAQSAPRDDDSVLQEQIDKVIAKAGFEVNEGSRKSAAWLMERDLPLTAENIKRLWDLREVPFPVTEEAFARVAAYAVAEGKDPVHANFAESGNIYEKAVAVLEHYQSEEDWTWIGGDITARRHLEEIRLRMTAEVNIKLIRSGFAIDTAPMEQLVEVLKQAERQIAGKYFPGDGNAVEKYQTYNAANETVRELPGLPAQILGIYSVRGADITVAQFHEEGRAIQKTYEQANSSYEALMTVPREELGDSIQKAFGNVDAILESQGMSLTEENRRAVRILGYNRMEMSAENIERVAMADEQVQSVIKKMTPASILKMIRDGINPLEKSFAELEQYFSGDSREYEESAESYSRFLYNLERRNDITENEKEAFIGIYRMLHQIERSDGAVVGALVNGHAQLHFANLLTAVRSSKFKHMDVKVQDSFGGLTKLVQKGESVSGQIARGYVAEARNALTEMSYSKEAQEEYQKEELGQVREAARTQNEAAVLLQKAELPVNVGNLLAVKALLQTGGNPFRNLKGKVEGRLRAGEKQDGQNEALTEAAREMDASLDKIFGDTWEGLEDGETFGEDYGRMVESLQEIAQEMTLGQAETSMDVRELQLLHKQLTIAGKLASAEEYMLPMYIGDNLANVHLTLEHDSTKADGVHIAVTLSEDVQIEAHFTLQEGSISGFLIGNTGQEVMKLKQAADIFVDSISGSMKGIRDISAAELPVITREAYAASSRPQDAHPAKVSGSELYHIAKLFLQAVKEEEVAYEN